MDTPRLRDTSAIRVLAKRPVLFWDVSFKNIDFLKHQRWVVARVLSWGTWDEIIALFHLYGWRAVRQAIQGNRAIDPKLSRFWLQVIADEDH